MRAPAAVDVDALVRTRGAVDARRDLEIRVIEHPRDIGARLALAAVATKLGFPGEALEQLATVEHLGGPLGARWRAADRARFGELLAARAAARIATGSGKALADLEHAARLGTNVSPRALRDAATLTALRDLRHVDAGVRARGRLRIAALSHDKDAIAPWRGARPAATAAERGVLGAYLWEHGAKRAAWEELAAWHAAPRVPSHFDDAIAAAYLAAYAWWTPDAPRPPVEDLVGPDRCRFADVPGCDPVQLVNEPDLDQLPTSALLAAPVVRTTAAAETSAWASITLMAALRGGGGWGALLSMHVDLDRLDLADVVPHARPLFARLRGQKVRPVTDAELAQLRPHERIVVAAERVLDGATDVEVATALGTTDSDRDTAARATLLRMAEPEVPERVTDPFAQAVTRALESRGLASTDAGRIIAAYRRDPAIADRLGRDVVLAARDAAVAHAGLGAVFTALGDPQRARLAWQAAVDLDPDPRFVAGLAEAMARAGDADAALIAGTTAAAASGDPAVTWLAIARALHAVGKDVHALEVARSAIDLASGDTLVAALDVAADCSRALGRTSQAESLRARRRALQPIAVPNDADPTDAPAALAAFARYDTSSTVARLWVASRWNPRDVQTRAALLGALDVDDPRRAVVLGEVVRLAGDADPETSTAALATLR